MNELDLELSGEVFDTPDIWDTIFETLYRYGEIFDKTVTPHIIRELNFLTDSGVLIKKFSDHLSGEPLPRTRSVYYEFSEQTPQASRNQIDRLFTDYSDTDDSDDWAVLSPNSRFYKRIQDTLLKMNEDGEIISEGKGELIFIYKTDKYRPPETSPPNPLRLSQSGIFLNP